MEELENCPFCGGEPHWFRDIDRVSIECHDCGFIMGVNKKEEEDDDYSRHSHR